MAFKNYFFVAMQFLLFIAWVIDIEALKFSRVEFLQVAFLVLSGIGLFIALFAILQLSTNLSPFPKPRKNAHLKINGVYKYIRHPMYSGIIIFLFFLSLYFASGYKIAIVFLLLTLFWFKSEYEEEQLCLKYPNYRDYRQDTGRFFPKFIR